MMATVESTSAAQLQLHPLQGTHGQTLAIIITSIMMYTLCQCLLDSSLTAGEAVSGALVSTMWMAELGLD